MTLTRRELFMGRRPQRQQNARDGVSSETPQDHKESLETALNELPSDFSPVLLKMQAKQMGLDVEHLSREEMAKAVLDVLKSQRPSEGPPEEDKPDERAS